MAGAFVNLRRAERWAPRLDAWLHEIKLDGYRLLARIDGPRVKLVTRRGNDWTEKFGPLVEALAGLKLRSAILDGEIVHLNPDGTSSFGALQEDLSEERPDRLCYFLFDVLALDGFVLTGCKLEDRKQWAQDNMHVALRDHLDRNQRSVGG